MVLRVDLRFPASHSLKEKRALLRPIVDGIRSRFEASVAVTDHAERWQRAELGIALVSGEVAPLERLADRIERFVWQADDTEILTFERNWLET